MREPAAWWQEPTPTMRMLTPLAVLYGAIASLRMKRQGERAGVPVICIGNPTTGGAGKTPTAIAIARLLQAAGVHPVFLSRGYGGRLSGPVGVDRNQSAADVGDEPLLLARIAPTIVSRDRVAGAAAAIAAGGEVIVMDDGFQNPALRKDLAFLVVDGRRGIGNGLVLPAGPLRAPLADQLERAQVLLVVGECSDRVAAVMAAATRRGLAILHGRLQPEPSVVAALRGEHVLAFAGIADPDKFFATIAAAGIVAPVACPFPDHHRYTTVEAADLLARAERDKLALLTTQKDHARLQGDPALAELRRRSKTLPVDLVFTDEDAVHRILAPLRAG